MVAEPKHPTKPRPYLAALGALAVAALLGWLVYDSLGTGELDFRRVHLSRAADPALFWVAEAFLAVMLLVALAALVVSLRATFRPEPPAKGPPPAFK
jgi:hypothetical protein